MAKQEYMNLWKMFLYRVARYLVILLITIIIVLPIIGITERSVRANALRIQQYNVEKAAADMQNKLNAFMTIGSLLAEDAGYRKLLAVTNQPSSSLVLDILDVQRQVFRFSLPHSYFEDVYLLFSNNDLYISNKWASQDYRMAYTNGGFNRAWLTAESWRESIVGYPDAFGMFATQIQSPESPSDAEIMLTLVSSINSGFFSEQRGVLVGTMDFHTFVGDIVPESDLEDYFLYLADPDDRIIASVNYGLDRVVEGNVFRTDSGVRYTAVRGMMPSSRYQLCLGISDVYFLKFTSPSVKMLVLYTVGGTLMILIISLLYSLHDTRKFSAVIDNANALLPSVNKPASWTNEMTYINGIISASATQMQKMRNSLKYQLLGNLFAFPVSPDESNAVEEIFDHEFISFCTVVIRMNMKSKEETLTSIAYYLTELLRTRLPIPYEYTHTFPFEFSILLDLRNVTWNSHEVYSWFHAIVDQLQAQVGEKGIFVHVGVSKPAAGIVSVYHTYIQAKAAINMYASENENGVYFYDANMDERQVYYIEINRLSKFYESIIRGDSDQVVVFFSQIMQDIQCASLSMEEQAQMLFSIQHSMFSAFAEICSMTGIDNQSVAFDIISPDQPLRMNLEMQEKTACNICSQVQAQRKQRNEKLKSDIERYTYENCFDLNFTLNSVAEQFRVSESYVKTLLREATGKSPKALIENLRVDKAEEMLRSRKFTNAQIAAACGFGSENTFYRAFARRHGVTPGKWLELSMDE